MALRLNIRDLNSGADERGRREPRRRKRKDTDGPTMSLRLPQPRTGLYAAAKRVTEVAAAAVLLVLTAPLVLLAGLLIKLTSRGPAYYTQTRVGLRGRPFTIYKLRTMIHNCESLTGPRWAMPDDPRITRLGYFLRVSHLDELPQLLNVLRGDMSLVGPRPERPEFVTELERALPAYRGRLEVRPGVTGLAQVQLPADSDLESVRRKLAHDLFYVRTGGLWLDVRLLLCTACRMVGIPFRVSGWVLCIPRHETVQEAMWPLVGEAARPRIQPRAA
jgi:lipopolysaccharide/colanic/teichoic acid biosynthesis glycosyltransferase